MQEILRILSQAQLKSPSDGISLLLQSSDSPGGLWVRLLVSLCVSSSKRPRSESASVPKLLLKWIQQSELSFSPICILGIHIHRDLIPDLFSVLAMEISSQIFASRTKISQSASRTVSCISYIATVRPAEVVTSVLGVLDGLLACFASRSPLDSPETLKAYQILISILQNQDLFPVLIGSIVSRFMQATTSNLDLEHAFRGALLSDAAVTPGTAAHSLFWHLTETLRSLIVTNCTQLEPDCLANTLLVLQTLRDWKIAPTADVLETVVGRIYEKLSGILSLQDKSKQISEVLTFCSALRAVLRNPEIERKVDPNTFNALFRWVLLANSVGAGSALRTHDVQAMKSPEFVSMLSKIFRSAYPAFYVDQFVLEKLASMRSTFSITEMLNILKSTPI